MPNTDHIICKRSLGTNLSIADQNPLGSKETLDSHWTPCVDPTCADPNLCGMGSHSQFNYKNVDFVQYNQFIYI